MYDSIRIHHMQLMVQSVAEKRGRWVKWHPLDPAFKKLNMDGAFNHDSGGGGGLVRDEKGDVLLAFISHYNCEDALGAEYMALHEGLQLCLQHQMHQVCVESDSELVIHMIKGDGSRTWKYYYWARHVKFMMQHFDSITVILREQNAAADYLAKSALVQQEKFVYTSFVDILRNLQRIIFLDRIGLLDFDLLVIRGILFPCLG